MKKYEVIITRDALKDIEDIYNYISKILHAPLAAYNLVRRIRKAIIELEYMPFRYPMLEYEADIAYRKIIVDNYIIIYTVGNDKVIVVNIFYGALNFLNKLRNRY